MHLICKQLHRASREHLLTTKQKASGRKALTLQIWSICTCTQTHLAWLWYSIGGNLHLELFTSDYLKWMLEPDVKEVRENWRGRLGVQTHHHLLHVAMFFRFSGCVMVLMDNLHSDVVFSRYNPFEIWRKSFWLATVMRTTLHPTASAELWHDSEYPFTHSWTCSNRSWTTCMSIFSQKLAAKRW